jgi:predicted amino acid dehydrogenase
MLFGASLLVGTDQWVPVAITGATGLALLAVAGWLAGVVDVTVIAGRS